MCGKGTFLQIRSHMHLLQVLAIEFVALAIEFITLAIEFVTLAQEFIIQYLNDLQESNHSS